MSVALDPVATSRFRPSSTLTVGLLITLLLVAVAILHDASISFESSESTVLRSPSGRLVSFDAGTSPAMVHDAIQGAQDFFRQRQRAYQNTTRTSTTWTFTMQGRPFDDTNVQETWRMRGMGYAQTRHNVVLAALLPTEPLAPGRNVIRIFNTVAEQAVDCSKWTLWVRVAGPEIFAGSAQAVPSHGLFPGQTCHWELPFNLQVVGQYEVDARLMLYNGKASPQGDAVRALCETQQNFDIPIDDFPISSGFLGFKFYSPLESCCEICSREPLCKYWVTPPLSVTPGIPRWSGCELFFHEPADSTDYSRLETRRRLAAENIHIPANESEVHPNFRSIKNMTGIEYRAGLPLIFHGKPHPVETSYFMGCGWSFWHTQTYPCLDPSLDDAILVFPSSQFDFSAERSELVPTENRLCTLQDEYPSDRFTMMTDAGRWVRLPWPDTSECPLEMKNDPSIDSFDVILNDGDRPMCWFRDDLSQIGKRCLEYCAHQDAHHPWQSSLKKETQHYSIWKNYQCDYLQFTDADLQQCVTSKRIGSYDVQGASIAEFVRQYVKLRFAPIELYSPPAEAADAVSNTTRPVKLVISTFKIPHVLWHKNMSQWREVLEATPAVAEDEEAYFLTGYYYSSEREPWVTVDLAESLAEMMQEILIPKGWRMLNGFDISAAFTYEVATQEDGLHMIGGPVKMVLTKLLHHLCHESLATGR